MDTIFERIKWVRKNADLTQQAFADRLGLKQNTIATYEMGKTTPSDRTISDICREFGVNEVWLRTGVGEMFAPLSRAEEIAEFIGKTLSRGTPFQQAFIAVLARTTPEEWAIFEKKLLELAEEMKKTDP